MAAFAPPYLVSGQALAVDGERFPTVRSVDDLSGLTIGVQQGNTSQPIAERLVARRQGQGGPGLRYGDIRAAMTDLTTGGCDAFMKLAPVLTELVVPVAGVEVVQRNISAGGHRDCGPPWRGRGLLAADRPPRKPNSRTTAHCRASGGKWLGNPYIDQSLAAH